MKNIQKKRSLLIKLLVFISKKIIIMYMETRVIEGIMAPYYIYIYDGNL
jgi:hypothetical protein